MFEASPAALAHTDDLLSRLVLQPADDPLYDVCAFYTCANLFVVCGLAPPKVEDILEIVGQLGGELEPGRGLTHNEIIGLLQALGFPRGLGTISLPGYINISEFVRNFLSTGFQLALACCFVVELSLEAATRLGDRDFAGVKVWLVHGVIPVSVEDDGINVITMWEVMPVTKIKAQEISAPDWVCAANGLQPIGISRDILMVWPDVRAGRVN